MDPESINADRLVRPEPARGQGSEQAKRPTGDSLNLKQGQRIEGTVVEVSKDGTVRVNVRGLTVSLPPGQNVTEGQSVMLRVARMTPNLLFELLGEASAGGKKLEGALSQLLQGQARAPVFWQSLFQGLQTAEAAGGKAALGEINQLLNSFRQLVQSMTDNQQQLPQAVRQSIATFNQSLETQLANLARQGGEQVRAFLSGSGEHSLQAMLKSLTSSSMKAMQQMLNIEAGERSMPAQVLARAAEAVNAAATARLDANIARLAATKISAVIEQARGNESGMLKSVRQLLARAAQPQTQGDLQRIIHALRSFSSGQQAPQAEARPEGGSLRIIERLANELERLMLQSRDGQRVVAGSELSRVMNAGEMIGERLEAFSRLNAANADRGQPAVFVFPFTFDKETTEVTLRHEGAREDKPGKRPLSMVMMLSLQSLGQIRLDVLLQQKKLHCHIFVEKDELAELVESMKPALTRQFQDRGITLAQFSCGKDSGKLNQASMLVSTFSDSDGGEHAVNLQI